VLKIIGYWTRPNDVEAFEEHYRTTHLPKAAAVPGLRRLVTVRPDSAFEGGEPEHYRIAEMVFDDMDALAQAGESPEYAAMRADAEFMHEKFGASVTGELGQEVISDLVKG
jgi:uncharacterized protein (TIGR02118 family)